MYEINFSQGLNSKKYKAAKIKKTVLISIICAAVLFSVGRILVSNVYGADEIITPVSISTNNSSK